jgi:hypothetical protein
MNMTNEAFVENGWEVEGIRDAAAFFDALVGFLPLPAYLCFEGTSIAPDIQALLEAHRVAPVMGIPPGTLWPKPIVFHLRASEPLLRQLASLARRHAEPEICDHFHAYRNSHGLLQWYDAFFDPLLVDEAIPETALQHFCSKLGVSYSQRRSG